MTIYFHENDNSLNRLLYLYRGAYPGDRNILTSFILDNMLKWTETCKQWGFWSNCTSRCARVDLSKIALTQMHACQPYKHREVSHHSSRLLHHYFWGEIRAIKSQSALLTLRSAVLKDAKTTAPNPT